MNTSIEQYNGIVKATPGPWEPTYIPSDLDPFSEIGRMVNQGSGRIYYVCAPQHPKSSTDGVTVIAITGNGPTSYDNATMIACVPEMLETLKSVYCKHQLNDDAIGWDELGDMLTDTLNNAMGPSGFVDWLTGLNPKAQP